MKNKFRKKDLKSGMWVKLRDGSKYLVMKNTLTKNYGRQDFCLINQDGLLTSDDYNNDLTNKNFERIYTIDSVYDGLVDANTYNGNKLKLLWEREDAEIITPKNGDIYYFKNSSHEFILICDSYKDSILKYYVAYDLKQVLLTYNYGVVDSYLRLATEKEKQLLFDELKNKNKRWNPDTNKIESTIEIGEICILWNNEPKIPIISKVKEIYNDQYYVDDDLYYNNAIKFISMEQYLEFIK